MSLQTADIYVGRNNKRNDVLTRRLPNDMWFHKKYPSYVIVEAAGVISRQDITGGCDSFRCSQQGKDVDQVPVDYTLVKCPKPKVQDRNSFYDNFKTLIVDADESVQRLAIRESQ